MFSPYLSWAAGRANSVLLKAGARTRVGTWTRIGSWTIRVATTLNFWGARALSSFLAFGGITTLEFESTPSTKEWSTLFPNAGGTEGRSGIAGLPRLR